MIRLLCVGLGGMGHYDWSAAAAVPDFELVAGVDVNEAARADFAKTTGSPTFTDLGEALKAVPADAALVATPDQFHAPFTIQALNAGLDVICEKPMAESLADARRMHQTAAANGRLLMIHHQLRWVPLHYHARRLITQGAIGHVRHLDFTMTVFSDACLHGYRSRLPQLILQDLSVHHFDLIRFLSGEECLSIYARTWRSNEEAVAIPTTTCVNAILEMTGPVTVCYMSNMRALLDQTGYGCTAVISGSKGELAIRPDRLELRTHAEVKEQKTPEPLAIVPPERSTWQDFAHAMLTRQPTLTASGDNLKSLEILFAAMASVERGVPVRPGELAG